MSEATQKGEEADQDEKVIVILISLPKGTDARVRIKSQGCPPESLT
jgi:hypothetical protein